MEGNHHFGKTCVIPKTTRFLVYMRTEMKYEYEQNKQNHNSEIWLGKTK